MKRLTVLALIGILALVVQGALATLIRPPYCPDLALLAVITIGLRWRGLALGLCLAALLGFSADLLSGSLMGQHALLRLFAFASAFLAGRQLNLKGSLPFAVFAGSLSLAYSLAICAVSAFFIGGSALTWVDVGALLQHAVVNGIAAPWMLSLVTRVLSWAGEDDAAARTLHIDAQRRPT